MITVVTIYIPTLNNNPPPPCQFLPEKLFSKNSSGKCLLNKFLNLNWGAPGPWSYMYAKTGYFHGKTKISKENISSSKLFFTAKCIAGGNVLCFLHLNQINYKIYFKNDWFLKWIVTKRRTEQFNFFNWLSNLKNLVFSIGTKNVQNVIFMALKVLFFPKISKKLPILPAAGTSPPDSYLWYVWVTIVSSPCLHNKIWNMSGKH